MRMLYCRLIKPLLLRLNNSDVLSETNLLEAIENRCFTEALNATDRASDDGAESGLEGEVDVVRSNKNSVACSICHVVPVHRLGISAVGL